MAERAARNERLIEENLARGRAQAAAKAKELEAAEEETETARVARRRAEIEEEFGKAFASKLETPLTYDSSKPYVPVVLQSGNFVECGACDKEARPGKKYCTDCAEYEG
jgi:hypothetical protein